MEKFVKNSLVFIILFTSLISKAQYNNNNWIVGLDALLIHFGDTVSNQFYNGIDIKYAYFGHSNINDSNGVVLICDGFNIYNKDGEFVENGKHILPEKLINSSQGGNYSRFNQQSIILPKKDNQFYVFAWGISDKNFDIGEQQGGGYIHDILTYSLVDMNANNGRGKVISKMNYLIEDDSLSICQMSAVRHANGRDWWLVKPHFRKHLFYTFLVTPDSIIAQPIQEFASPLFTNGVIGQSNFSEEGSLYVMTSGSFQYFHSQVNHFDRCSGKMTPYKTIPWVYDSTVNDHLWIEGACFSPNNHFVYLINNVSISQYDLTNEERIELEVGGFSNPNGNTVAYNAPNGRIYIGNYNGTGNSMSYIEYPNKKGLDASYCLMCYKTKNFNTKTPPNMPNYTLGALKGSECDTIGKIIPPKVGSLLVYPNPAKSKITIEYALTDNQHCTLQLIDLSGRIVKELSLSNKSNKVEISVSELATGIYTLKQLINKKQARVSKLVVD